MTLSTSYSRSIGEPRATMLSPCRNARIFAIHWRCHTNAPVPLRSAPSRTSVKRVCCALSGVFRSTNSGVGIDFYQFWAVGRAVARHESSDNYSLAGRARLGAEFLTEAMNRPSPVQRVVAARRRNFDTASTPFLYAIFGGLSTDDYESNLRWYRILLLSCFVASTVGVAKLLGHSTTNLLLSLALFALWFEPLASDLRVGNVSCIQLFGIVVYAYLRLKLQWRYKDLFAGTWMGMLLAFKPNLVFVAIVLLLGSLHGRKWKPLSSELGGMAAGAGAAIGVSAWAFGGLTPWFDWVATMRRLSSEKRLALVRAGWHHALIMLAWLGVAVNAYAMLGLRFTVRSFAVMLVLASYALPETGPGIRLARN
jgi:hypothetical protein